MMSSKKVLRGYGYEFILAQKLIDVSQGEGSFSTEEYQWNLIDNRRRYARELEELYPSEFEDLCDGAQRAALNLPKLNGELSFSPATANGSEVYDIIYRDSLGETVKVSCKTAEVWDKSCLLDSQEFVFDKIQELADFVFHDTTKTYGQLLEDYGFHNKEVFIDRALEFIVEDSSRHKEDSVLLRMTRDRFIGTGGYYKTTMSGGARYYPKLTDSHEVKITSIHKDRKKIIYTVDILSSEGTLIHTYEISVHVSFSKDTESYPQHKKDGHIRVPLICNVVLSKSGLKEYH